MVKKSYIDIVNESKAFFEKRIFEQDVAVDEVVYALYEKAKRSEKSAPREIFLFCGAPSSGKRYLSEEIAQFDQNFTDFITFDMSRFAQAGSGDELYGMAVDDEGNLNPYGEWFVLMNEKPKSVVLFDNIDKADDSVQISIAKILESPESGDHLFDDAGKRTLSKTLLPGAVSKRPHQGQGVDA